MQKGLIVLSIKSLIITYLCFCSGLLYAQGGIYNNGANIVTTTGSNIYIDGSVASKGNYLNATGGIIKNTSTGTQITLTGNWTNNASNTVFTNNSPTTGATVLFNGANAQSIGGTNPTGFFNVSASGAGLKTFITSTSTISNLLTLGSSTTVNGGGKLTLLADATKNANVAAIPSGSSVTGSVNVQVYFTGNGVDVGYRGTRAISSPVTAATYAQLKQYMVITGKNGGGFDLGGTVNPYGVSLTKYTESNTSSQSQFTAIESINDVMTPGVGTLLMFRGSREGYDNSTPSASNKVNAPFTAPEAVTATYTGILNQQNVSVAVGFTNNGDAAYDGYQLIGNPYASVINWDLVTKSGLTDELKFFMPTTGYVTYIGGVTTSNGFSGNIKHIMPGQAFYVKAQSGGGNVTFTEASKVTASPSPMRLMSAPNQSFSDKWAIPHVSATTKSKELRINLQNATHIDESVAVFGEKYTAKATSEDAISFGGSTLTLSSLSEDNKRLTINFMPRLKDVSELKLNVNSTASGPVKLNFTDLEATQGYEVTLHDLLLNTITPVTSGLAYNFEINKSVPTSFGDDRFKLTFKKAISSLNFSVKKLSNGSEINWSLLADGLYGNFEIERSEDGVSFKALGKVTLTSADAYSFIDKNPVSGSNYYRIKQIDNEGRILVSEPIRLSYLLDEAVKYTVFPNPATDIITVDLNFRKGAVLLTILDLQGKEIKHKVFEKTETITQKVSDMVPGVYVLRLREESTGDIITVNKFIKE